MELSEYIRIIMSEIKPADESIAKEILDLYLKRTKEHVKSVNEYGKRACEVLKDYEWCCLLRVNLVKHDHDKLNDGEFIAHYAPYVVKRYALSDLKDRFEVTEQYNKQWNDIYVVQHCKNNGHHPEGWCKTYNYGDNFPPYDATTMPPEYMAEMVCDWCAVGHEQGNDPLDWFYKVNRERFIFSELQQKFIKNLIIQVR